MRIGERVAAEVGEVERFFAPEEARGGKEGFSRMVLHVSPFAEIRFGDGGFTIQQGKLV